MHSGIRVNIFLLLKIYIRIIQNRKKNSNFSGYLNEQGTLNLKRFQQFMETLANFDYDQFRDTYADIKFLEGKRTANITTSNKVGLFHANN